MKKLQGKPVSLDFLLFLYSHFTSNTQPPLHKITAKSNSGRLKDTSS